jgi:phage tail sheath protein FI
MGKRTLVWGFRTLSDNDNEWRCVPMRSFFNMVEDSVKKSTFWVVFELNAANNVLGRDIDIVVNPKPRSRQQALLRVAAA